MRTTRARSDSGASAAQTAFPGMFSAASFFDVINAKPGISSRAKQSGLSRPPVIAFYGFRGGAGRSLALAHVATLLARRGARVAAVDLDLEAPGLHVLLDVPSPSDGGAADLLRAAAMGEVIDAKAHVRPSPLGQGSGQLFVVPAGAITPRYLAVLEELGVGMWHATDRPNPVRQAVESLRDVQPDLDAVLVDCRTGFSGMAASVLFHVADVAVVFFPLSEQVWEGISIVLDAAKAARQFREGRPALLFVPSIVPPGAIGDAKLVPFEQRLVKEFGKRFGEVDFAESEDPDRPEWLLPPIRYDVSLAISGRVDVSLQSSSWKLYEPLADAVAAAAEIATHVPRAISESLPLDTRTVLQEIVINDQLAFAELPKIEQLKSHFVRPSDYENVVHSATSVVVGAKGAGKTWLWRYLVSGGAHETSTSWVAGHGPASAPEASPLQLSPDAFREIERNAKLEGRETYRAFWLLYAAACLAKWKPDVAGAVLAEFQGDEKKALRAVQAAVTNFELKTALETALLLPNAGTLAEQITSVWDAKLLGSPPSKVILAYDGLDTGFETQGARWEDRRNRFVGALLQVILETRVRNRCVHYKVFLREDIWSAVSIQNKSHIEPVKVELRWKAEDLWKMALGIAATSNKYLTSLQQRMPGLASPWEVPEKTLKRALEPLWGETIERGKQARTPEYIQKRTSDAIGRLFPRTLVQILKTAIDAEKTRKTDPPADRVIRFTSLRDGIRKASNQRVADLTKEYVHLREYLALLKQSEPTGTRREFSERLRRRWQNVRKAGRAVKGAPAGALHAGPGGWGKVIGELETVGVLGPYRRTVSDDDEQKLQVALLYRHGLGIRGAGLG